MQSILNKHWHHLPISEVVDLLDTDLQQGLGAFETQRRQKHFGPNQLTPSKGRSPLVRFLLQFNNPLVMILIVASGVTAVLKDPADAIVILAVVVINAIIGYIQEARAEQAIAALAQTMTTEAVALRDGKWVRLPAAGLVPGDVVQLQAGARVPADLRLAAGRDLQVTEAALTGESLPVAK
jgi:cation-transporting ATPase F